MRPVQEVERMLNVLDSRRSKNSVIQISDLCFQEGLFDALYKKLKSAQVRRRGSISWVLAHAVKNTHWVPNTAQINGLMVILSKENEDVMCKRCLLDVFQSVSIPEDVMGQLVDLTISSIRDPKQSLAIRSFAITVLGRIIQRFPEVYSEVEHLLNELVKHGKPSIKSRANRLMDMMEKQ